MSSFISAVIILAVGSSLLLNAEGGGEGRGRPCYNNPCKNGGTCVSPLDYPICHCVSGFGGDYCENKVPVKPGICNHPQDPENGTCIRSCDNDYNCTGSMKCCSTFCERVCTDSIIFDPCFGYCLNGGVCSAPADAPTCRCPARYTGIRCETYVRTRPGKCPVVTGKVSGVCGGVFCSKDNECEKGQKCCKAPCGGFLCTNV